MALSHQPVFVQTPKIQPAAFTNADSANTKKTVATAGADGSKVTAVTITSTDSSPRIAQLWLTRAAVSYLLTSLDIPAGSGSDGALPSVDLINITIWPGLTVDNVAQRFFYLQSGDALQVSFTTQVTAAKEIDVTAVFANF